jgi:hypothetical protein
MGIALGKHPNPQDRYLEPQEVAVNQKNDDQREARIHDLLVSCLLLGVTVSDSSWIQ